MRFSNRRGGPIEQSARDNRAALLRHVRSINQWRAKYPTLMRLDNEMAALALSLLDGLGGNW